MLERMADFFDKRAEGYEAHMKHNIDEFEAFYESVSSLLPAGKQKLEILDLGVGTGLELDLIIKQLPAAEFCLIDLSKGMLDKLAQKFVNDMDRIELVNTSYLSYKYPYARFDYVISVQSLHHLLFSEKVKLYNSIAQSLKPEGSFIEADFIVSPQLEKEYLKRFFELTGNNEAAKGEYHLDIPFSKESTELALKQAGLRMTDIAFSSEYALTYKAQKL